MDTKQEMLDCITSSVDLIMVTSDYSLIPYYSLDNNTIGRIKEYFSYDIESEDIVALISTSVMDPGKTGIVFTTSTVYTRDWGFFPDTDDNWYWDADGANFSSSNDFDKEMLRIIMKELFDISMNGIVEGFKDVKDATKDIAQGFKDLFDALGNLNK